MTGTSKFLSYDSCLREEFNKHLSYCASFFFCPNLSSAIAPHPFLFDPVFFSGIFALMCWLNVFIWRFILAMLWSRELTDQNNIKLNESKKITKVIKDFMSKISFTAKPLFTPISCLHSTYQDILVVLSERPCDFKSPTSCLHIPRVQWLDPLKSTLPAGSNWPICLFKGVSTGIW